MAKGFRERFILTELHRDERIIKIAFIVIGLILAGNILYVVNLSVKNNKPKNTENKTKAESFFIPISSISPSPITTTTPTVAQPSPTPIIIIKEAPASSIKDYYIPFGTGSNQTDDWTDVSGLQATIDFGSYQNIKEVRFEVSVNIPTSNQTASVRLFNETDRHPVWFSEVVTTNNVYTVSAPIVYDNSPKVYKVQMKTQLKFLANLTLSRIHIVLK